MADDCSDEIFSAPALAVQVNDFAGLIRGESPFMFLSEVKISPNYPPRSRPHDPTTFDAVFEVSSVE